METSTATRKDQPLSTLELSAVIPTRNPHRGRLERVLAALERQTLSRDRWEIILVDNGSENLTLPSFAGRIVHEPKAGLTYARQKGISESTGNLIVLVDDDNELDPAYFASALEIFSRCPELGTAGGKIAPEFETRPEPWIDEFHTLLALRDLGESEIIPETPATPLRYPSFAPVGAGMVLRREAATHWLESCRNDPPPPDRQAGSLSSSGDNDIVLRTIRAGWRTGYFPSLRLLHLIPAARLEPDYLARLNRETQTSWMKFLLKNNSSPWPALSRTNAALRKFKAWFTYHPWTSPAARIRHAGVCGHFEGRVSGQ